MTKTIDAVTVSVFQGALENIAIEMGWKLMRMAYSSIIRESEDFGAGLVDADGRGLAESVQSTPLQSGPGLYPRDEKDYGGPRRNTEPG